MIRAILSPAAQVAIAVFVIVTSIILFVFACLRVTPLKEFALAPEEPFWILILSIGALLYAGFSALPAALAYREAKEVNVNAKEAQVQADEVTVEERD